MAVSVARTVTSSVPTSALPGVPIKTRVAGLKVSQAGKSLPLARLADKRSLSPTSASWKVSAGNRKINCLSCRAWPGAVIPWVVGAVLGGAMVRLKMVAAVNGVPGPLSVATTLTLMVSKVVGTVVALNVRVALSKLNQLGNTAPLAKVAVSVKIAPGSSSVKVTVLGSALISTV